MSTTPIEHSTSVTTAINRHRLRRSDDDLTAERIDSRSPGGPRHAAAARPELTHLSWTTCRAAPPGGAALLHAPIGAHRRGGSFWPKSALRPGNSPRADRAWPQFPTWLRPGTAHNPEIRALDGRMGSSGPDAPIERAFLRVPLGSPPDRADRHRQPSPGWVRWGLGAARCGRGCTPPASRGWSPDGRQLDGTGATPVAGTTQSPAIEGPQALARGRR